jgi:(4S)-4-hydroxy-5-phosphonooxypentane-2,3-dione isomerase
MERLIMFIVHVQVHVKAEFVEAFREATIENAQNSVQEAGIARFDIVQQVDDPTHFVLVEVYLTPEDPAHHKETDHYKKWAEAVAPMMVQPRSSLKYTNIFPGDSGWG